MKYGSLLRGISRIGLWPPQETSDINLSIDGIAAKLRTLEILRFNHYYGSCLPNSYGEYKKEVEGELSKICSPLSEYHRQHMEAED
jgi:hypothetical protein